jgi:hypothetical protein
LSIRWHFGIEVDELRQALGQPVRYATNYHASVAVTDQRYIMQILVLQQAYHVLDVCVQIDVWACKMRALAQPGEGWGKNLMAGGP